MDKLTPHLHSVPRPEVCPQPEQSSRRPPELDDRKWLARRYAQVPDEDIAVELGVDRKTVRAARLRLGIRSHPVGPRRGSQPRLTLVEPTPMHVGPDDRPVVLQRVEARYAADQLHGIPPTWDQVIQRFKNANTARKEHDRYAEADAAISMAAALARVATQLLESF